MKPHVLPRVFGVLILGLFLLFASRTMLFAAPVRVNFARVPNGGIQPQVVVRGNKVSLVYFKGAAQAGDLFYVSSQDGGATWTTPLQVNSQSGSAIAMGSIRGATLAVGRNGRVFVAWNGSDRALPRNSGVPAALQKYGAAPLLFTRLNAAGTGFEAQRNLLKRTFNLDGGASVAADEEGHVYVAWHANTEASQDETGRRIFLTTSRDDGATFREEKPVWNEPTGACGCCQVRVAAQNGGRVGVLYRAATQNVHRDSYFLQSNDGGASFVGQKLDDWNLKSCPMSSYALAMGAKTNWAAWGNRGQIYFSALDAGKITPQPEISSAPESGQNRKYPVLATGKDGALLLAWTENTAWDRGGLVRFQLFDAARKPLSAGTRDGIPAWSFAATFTDSAGNFTVLY